MKIDDILDNFDWNVSIMRSWRESSKEAENNKSEKRRNKRDIFKIQETGIESNEKKFKHYVLTSKEKVKVQQISSYNRQKLESKQQLKLKTCITGKEKDDQNVSRILNQSKVSRIPRPMKKESDRQPTKVSKGRF